MTSRLFQMRRPAAGLLLFGLLAVAMSPAFAQEKQYVTTTLRGRLTEAKGKPVAGAILRFTPIDTQAAVVETITDIAGAFDFRSSTLPLRHGTHAEAFDTDLHSGAARVSPRCGVVAGTYFRFEGRDCARTPSSISPSGAPNTR